jgi:hypothetical protein
MQEIDVIRLLDLFERFVISQERIARSLEEPRHLIHSEATPNIEATFINVAKAFKKAQSNVVEAVEP